MYNFKYIWERRILIQNLTVLETPWAWVLRAGRKEQARNYLWARLSPGHSQFRICSKVTKRKLDCLEFLSSICIINRSGEFAAPAKKHFGLLFCERCSMKIDSTSQIQST